VRVVSDEGDIGRGHLSRFQELETITPAPPVYNCVGHLSA